MTTIAQRIALAKGPATHLYRRPTHMEAGKWVYAEDRRKVRVMAIADGYAMVRLKGAMPYVCPIKELTQP